MGIFEIEPSVQMRLYSLSKGQFVVVFLVFFCCFGLSVITGLAGPPITETVHVNASSLAVKPKSLNKGPFVVRSPLVSSFHQQLWLMADIVLKNPRKGMVTFPFKLSVEIHGLYESGHHILYNGTSKSRQRTLTCYEICEELVLLHLGFVDYPRYLITVNFQNLENLHNDEIADVVFIFRSYNPAFTQLQIWFRFVFLVLTFISTCLLAHSLRRFSLRDWSIEQKWMSVLLPLLLLYNNPIFPLTFLINSWIPGTLDALFQATFLCALLLFWLCLYHGVRQNKRKFVSFYLPKLLVVELIWVSAVSISFWQEYQEILDPTYNYRLDVGNFMAFKILFFLMGSVYMLFLVYLLVRACAELRTMPFFDLRLKFMTGLVFIVLTVSVVIMCLRFGQKILHDNFVAEVSSHFNNSAEFLAFYGLLNFYLYTMAYVYSPSRNAVLESHFKDNPALSMINDSDDEVVYGSDDETQTLTRKSYNPDEDAFN